MMKIKKESESLKSNISMKARFIMACMKAMSGSNLFGNKIQTGQLQRTLLEVEPEWKCPQRYCWEKISMRHYQIEWIGPPKESCRKVIFQIHGGGYVNPLKNIYRDFAVKYCDISPDTATVCVDYRVAPEHPYPAALLDVIDAYAWTRSQGFDGESVVFAGDSAGGGLCLALSMWLRDHDKPLPDRLVLMSPWTDLTASGPSYDENYESDPMFGGSRESMIYQKHYQTNHDPMNPYISPLFGNFRGLPPMLFQVGSIEMLRSDSELAANKARHAGCKVSLHVYPELFHVFQMGLDHFPESLEAWNEIEGFLR